MQVDYRGATRCHCPRLARASRRTTTVREEWILVKIGQNLSKVVKSSLSTVLVKMVKTSARLRCAELKIGFESCRHTEISKLVSFVII